MTDTTPHRATAEQWADCEHSARIWPGAFNCILELLARIEALEAGATCPHVVSSDEGTSYCGLAEQQAAAATPPEPAPDQALLMRINNAWPDGSHTKGDLARAAIRAVAEWLDTRGQHGCSLWLREEVER